MIIKFVSQQDKLLVTSWYAVNHIMYSINLRDLNRLFQDFIFMKGCNFNF